MRTAIFLLAASTLTLSGASAQGPEVFSHWAAFDRQGPRSCYAISRPEGPKKDASASVGYWPERRIAGQFHARFSQPRRDGSAIILRIDDRIFQLVGGGRHAWAPDPAADALIVGAMRTGMSMVVETKARTGRTMRDRYRLRGAASAIDAAAISCTRR